MTEMMERIARAINPVAWIVESHGPQREETLRGAKRVLEAMRDPTEAMVRAGTLYWDPMDGGPISAMFEPTKPYQAMIAEALK
jgi:hypothetical protein